MAKKKNENNFQEDWMLTSGGDASNPDDWVETWDTEAFGVKPASWYKSQGLTKPKVDVRRDRSVTTDGTQTWDSVGNIIEEKDKGLEATTGLKAKGPVDKRQYHCNTPGGIPYMCGPDDPNYTGPEKRKAPSWDSFYGGYAQPKVDPRTAKKQQKFMDSRSGKSTKKFYDSRSARKAAKR